MQMRILPQVFDANASPMQTAPAGSFFATVLSMQSDGRVLLVGSEEVGEVMAFVALSCLVAPEVGDRVWAVAQSEDAFILSVLSRPDPRARIELRSDRNVAWKCAKDLEIQSEGDLRLTGKRSASLSAPELSLHARTLNIVHRSAQWVGERLEASIQELRGIGQTMSATFSRIRSHSENSVRVVEQSDVTRAGSIEQRAETLLAQRATDLVVDGKRILKMDGKQVHIG